MVYFTGAFVPYLIEYTDPTTGNNVAYLVDSEVNQTKVYFMVLRDMWETGLISYKEDMLPDEEMDLLVSGETYSRDLPASVQKLLDREMQRINKKYKDATQGYLIAYAASEASKCKTYDVFESICDADEPAEELLDEAFEVVFNNDLVRIRTVVLPE